jgi:hypothetical protein
MIWRCGEEDFEAIWEIINDGAQAYRGVIPEDCWAEPYMSREKLQHEIDDGVVFWGCEEDEGLAGVMGIQNVQDVTLIRHGKSESRDRSRAAGASGEAGDRADSGGHMGGCNVGDSVLREIRLSAGRH